MFCRMTAMHITWPDNEDELPTLVEIPVIDVKLASSVRKNIYVQFANLGTFGIYFLSL